MSSAQISPNELADLYESLYTMLEALPADTHPAWEVAIESVLFGGEALAPSATSYGKQQSERNGFKISNYRAQYGDGEKILDFPVIATRSPAGQDAHVVDEEVQIPVAPQSDTVLPLSVDTNTLPDAISSLNEFPTAPEAETKGETTEMLLNPDWFPGLRSQAQSRSKVGQETEADEPGVNNAGLPPNELADFYDAFRIMLETLPDDVHPCWKEAIESVVYGGEYLLPDSSAYGEQQAQRNGFGMPDYRSEYGNGDRVTVFPTISTTTPREEDDHHIDTDIELPVAPDSGTVLPLDPPTRALPDAIFLLTEFPAEPEADIEAQESNSLLDTVRLLADIGQPFSTDVPEATPPSQSTSSTTNHQEQAATHSTKEPHSEITEEPKDEADTRSDTGSQETSTTPETEADNQETSTTPETEADNQESTITSETAADSQETSTDDLTTLRNETAGESTLPRENNESSGSKEFRKYDDAEAERAHRNAQQRDPSDVVELGEEITLTLKQVDYSSRPPTIMGTKNRLVIFVINAPQDLSLYDTIRAKVVDYGGKNNSAEAAFSGYVR